MLLSDSKVAWQPYRETVRATVMRTGAIAAVLGAVFVGVRHGRLRDWPVATLLMLWPTFGGHWVEIFFLNWLRPRISSARAIQVGARLVTWYIGGVVLFIGMQWTSVALNRNAVVRWPAWWIGGVAFIGIEMIAHLVLQIRGVHSFYNGRG
jgi:hypothetical protein